MTSSQPFMTKRTSDDDQAEELRVRFHCLAERLQAASGYLAALQQNLRDGGNEHAIELVSKAAQQADAAIEEFHRLRRQFMPQ